MLIYICIQSVKATYFGIPITKDFNLAVADPFVCYEYQ